MKRIFKPSLLLMMVFISLLITTGCKNKRYQTTSYDERPCGIIPELKKTLKDYDVVGFGSVREGLFAVHSRSSQVDETGQNYYPMGCIDTNGNVVIPIKYHSVRIGDEMFVVSKLTNQGMRFGLLDIDGNELLPMEYEEISLDFIFRYCPGDIFSYNYLIVKKNGLYGLLDKKCKVVIPIQFESVGRLYPDGAYRSYKEEELPDIYLAYSNKNGKPKLFNFSPEKMEKKPSTPYDVVPFGKDGNWSFMDCQGHIIAGPFQNARLTYDAKKPLFPSDGLMAVVKNNKVGFIDMKGTVKIPFSFYYSEFNFNFHSFSFAVFSEGLAAMMKPGNKWGYINKEGKEIIPFVYDWGSCFHQGVALVAKGKRLGLIDKNNTVILPFEFENGVFTGSVYTLCQNGKWGVYSPTGVCVTPCQYDQQITFVEGYATVVKNGKQGLINEQGQLLIPCEYETCLYDVCTGADMVYVVKDGKWGCVDLQGQVLVPVEFDAVDPCREFYGSLFYVKKDGRFGLYDRCGNCTLD